MPGGNRLPEPSPAGLNTLAKAILNYAVPNSTRVPREVEEQTIGAERFPLWSGPDSVMRRPHNPTILHAILTGEPYPVNDWIIISAKVTACPGLSRRCYDGNLF